MSAGVALTLFVGMCCALQWKWFTSRMATLRSLRAAGAVSDYRSFR